MQKMRAQLVELLIPRFVTFNSEEPEPEQKK